MPLFNYLLYTQFNGKIYNFYEKSIFSHFYRHPFDCVVSKKFRKFSYSLTHTLILPTHTFRRCVSYHSLNLYI